MRAMLARLRSLWRGLRHRSDVEAEMSEEFRNHLTLRTEDLIRRGLAPEAAARQARLEFGHIDSHKEDARASRGLRVFDAIGLSWLDVKLGIRMFRKYPGLSIVSVLGMSVAIAIGAGAFGAIAAMMDPDLPLDEGNRVVSIQINDASASRRPHRQVIHDLIVWRRELRSMTDLAAFMSDRQNLIVPGRGVELVSLARMTASGFRVARVAPVRGRPLRDDDEAPGAPPVVVIAWEEWQRRFDGDAGIVGRTVRLGNTVHTIVGVMPEGFQFPVKHHFWVPLSLNPTDYEPGGGPSLFVFGRLADGVTMQRAQVELTMIGRRLAATFPETHRNLRPAVLPYSYPFLGIDDPLLAWLLHGVQLAVSLLLVVVAVNVAILVYARTASRTGEIAVRTALGASRGRIVRQLFAEALFMAGTAAAIGLTIAGIGLRVTQSFQERAAGDTYPFWVHLGLSPGVVFYTVGLAALAAIIVGVLPALQATGPHVQARLQQLSSHGSGGLLLGRTWTVLVVAQVAMAVTALPFAVYVAGQSVLRATGKPGYATNRILRAELSMERLEAPPDAESAVYEREFTARFRQRAAELLQRLESEPTLAGVTFASAFPDGGTYRRVEVERSGLPGHGPPGGAADPATRDDLIGSVLVDSLDVELLRLFGIRMLAGRGFERVDRRAGSNAVIVDRVFVDRFLNGGNAIGRRVRFVRRTSADPAAELETGPWLEIVGVVPDFTFQPDFESPIAGLYQPLGLDQAPTVLNLALVMRKGTPASFTSRLREIAAAVDPTLQLHDVRSAADAQWAARGGLLGIVLVIVAVTGSVLLLSAAGIYAMTSFAVAQRQREIGIRLALGADPRRLLTALFGRTGAQLGAGVSIGLVLAAAIRGPVAGKGLLLLPLVAVVMLLIGLLAALGPARRGLSVQPTEALRSE